jgi:branched-chain amino acid transport system permease protein
MQYRRIKQLALLGAIVASLVLSQFSSHLNSYYLQVLIFIGINVSLAVSLNLINGYTGQFSLGHAGFMAIGAYASAYLSSEHSAGLFKALGGVNTLTIFVLFASVLLLGGLAAALAGLIVGVPSLRLKGDYLAIVTLGFGEIIRVLIQNTDAVGGPRGYSGIANYTTIFWTYSIAAVTIYVVTSLIDSTYGRGFLTVRDDEIAAEAIGINTTRYKVTAFVLGAFFAGVAGGLYAHTTTYINPSGFDFQLSIQIVVMVILGGMGSTIGVAFAAVLLTLLLEYLRFVAGYAWLPEIVRQIAANRMIIFSLALIALMLLRPQGLFGALGKRAGGGRAGGLRKTPKPEPGPSMN